MKKIMFVFVMLFVFVFSVSAESLINKEDSFYKMALRAESGFLTVLSHTIQFGNDGTKFDYKEDGNQDVLFPYSRFEAEFRLFDTHGITFLYQPLEIVTKAKLSKESTFYDVTFLDGTDMNVKYGFSFFRASYVWYFLKDKKNELGIGLSMQIRNASIIFEAADGSDILITENVGPVPIIKIAGKLVFDNGIWTAIDADGFYASSAVFNGSEYPFVGAIWDVSGRVGMELKNGINPYLNIRVVGGGALGTSQGEDTQGDGFTENWLNVMSVTLGVEIN